VSLISNNRGGEQRIRGRLKIPKVKRGEGGEDDSDRLRGKLDEREAG